MKDPFETQLEGAVRFLRAMRDHGIGSEEADAIRDELDETWFKMTEGQKALIRSVYALGNDLMGDKEQEIDVLRRKLQKAERRLRRLENRKAARQAMCGRRPATQSQVVACMLCWSYKIGFGPLQRRFVVECSRKCPPIPLP